MEFLSPSSALGHAGVGEKVLYPESLLGTDLYLVWSLFSLGFNCSHRDRHSLTTYSDYTCFTDDETETQKG